MPLPITIKRLEKDNPMPKDIHVLLIEDDLYARDLMSLLLTRDWRTRVVGEVGTEDDVHTILQKPAQHIDAIILDTEVPDDPEWPFRIAALTEQMEHTPTLICTATKANPAVLRRLLNLNCRAYLLKREVRYSLACAITEATKNEKWVITPNVYRMALRQRIRLPLGYTVLDGTRPVTELTPREAEVARLAILFNVAHRDLSDELLIRADQVSKYVSNTYTKLGLDDILNGEIQPEVFFQDKVVLAHFRKILSRVEGRSHRKTSDMATLAFHLLTVPRIDKKI
jgi:DNA-binding NarL/FixJ family response regulator